MINEKAIRVVAFSGQSKDYRMWSARFMAGARVKKYHECLIEDFAETDIMKKKVAEAMASETGGETASVKVKIEKDIKEGITAEQVEMVMRAYADLMLACTEDI